VHAEALDARREAGCELGGMHPRHVRREASGLCARDAQPRLQLVCSKLAQVIALQGVGTAVGDLGAQALRLRAVERDRQMAALDEVRVDRVLGQDRADLVDGREHRLLQRRVAGAADSALVDVRWTGEEPRDPSAVAPRRAEARVLALEHHDLERRLRALEIVRGPQARVSRPRDRDVGFHRPVERRPRCGWATQRAPPVAELPRPHSLETIERAGMIDMDPRVRTPAPMGMGRTERGSVRWRSKSQDRWLVRL
jgi:hypothetical protein